jgi:hypothetical protein
MAKGKKYIDLNAAQKDEIRRLTQLANRRIKSAHKAFSKEGKDVVPKEIVGPYQIKEQWNTASTPMSRSVKFESTAAYRAHLKFLRSFDPKAPGESRPGVREYTKVQREKTLLAAENAMGTELPKNITKAMNKMTAPQLSTFWNVFSDKAAKMGEKYSSDSVMAQTLAEFFPEDMMNFNSLTREFVTKGG